MSNRAVGLDRPRGRRFTLVRLLSAVYVLAVLVLGACQEMDRGAVTGPDAPAPAFIITAPNYTYTLDADFDQGVLVNVNHNAPNNNQLQLNVLSGTFPFIWVSLSQRCTIAKINTATGAILGEYRTVADGVGCAESSRTTVAIDGSVWVGHRGFGGVAHVGLNELSQCVDRNGNGTIQTSTGYGDVLPWPGVSPSNVANAADECILHHVNTDAQGFGDTRHMSIDPNNNLWVGSFVSRRFIRVNGNTGALDLATLKTGFSCGGYGGLIDKNGIIWSANGAANGLLRWDPNSPDVAGVNPRCVGVPNYGLAIDPAGWIWANEFGNFVRKVSPDGNTILGPFANGMAGVTNHSQGLAVTANGDVWISSGLSCSVNCPIGHLKNNGTFVGNVPNPTGAGSTGVSVDAAGKIWSANRAAHTATRIDPALGAIGADGVTPIGAVDLTVNFPATAGRPVPFPYNYSDMTGSQILTTIAQGSWTVVQDGGALGTPWQSVSWNATVPGGALLTVEARASDTQAGLGSQTFVPVTSGGALGLTGQFIQVRVTMRASAAGASPILADLTISSQVGDRTAPFCALSATGTDTQGRKFIEVTTRDQQSGLASIVVTKATNLSANVPAFTVGTTAAVVVRATKLNQSTSSALALRVTDVAGNITNCDPVDVTVPRSSGAPETHTFSGLPQAEHWVDVNNENPGLTSLRIEVNGKVFQVAGLKDGEKRTLSVASAMKAGNNNTIKLTPTGKPGGSAWVVIRD